MKPISKTSYLFSLLLTLMLGWQSIDLTYKKADGWTFQTKELPIVTAVPWLIIICAAAGFETDGLTDILNGLIPKKTNE